MQPVIRRTRVGLMSGRRLSSLSIAKVTPCVRIMMERAVVRVAGFNGNELGGTTTAIGTAQAARLCTRRDQS